jgi:hypothetical protein
MSTVMTGRRDGMLTGFVVGVATTIVAAALVWATNADTSPRAVAAADAGQQGTIAGGATLEGSAFNVDPDSSPSGLNGTLPTSASGGGPAVTGSGSSSHAATNVAGGGDTATQASGLLPAGPDARGVTDTTIKLGFQTADAASFNAAAAALGLGGDGFDESVDGNALRRAVIQYLNKRGGIGGREIEEVTYEILASDAVTPEGRAKSGQEGCAKFTEDDPVFAFSDGGGMWSEDNVTQCAVDHQTLFIQLNLVGAVMSAARYAEVAPYYLAPNRFLADANDALTVDHLVSTGLLPKDAKVGLMIDEVGSSQQSAQAALKPALARHGIEVAAEVVYPDVIESPWDTYVLQFRSAGVTHVLFGASSYGFWPVQMMLRAAESQQWYPQWRGSSEMTTTGQAATAPAAQLPNLAGSGFMPAADTNDEAELDAAYPPSPRCREAMKEAGLPEDEASNATLVCMYLFLLADGFAHAPELSAAGLQQGLLALGDSFELKLARRVQFRPGRPDGAASLQPFGWVAECECFRYLGPVTNVP